MRSKTLSAVIGILLVFGVLNLAVGSALAKAPQKSKTHIVNIVYTKHLFKFEPQTITIRKGQTVTWVNKTKVNQTATSNDFTWDTKTIKPHKKKTLTFHKKGKIGYHDAFVTYAYGYVKVK